MTKNMLGAACQGWRAQNARLMTFRARTCQCTSPSYLQSAKPSLFTITLSASVARRTVVAGTDQNEVNEAVLEELCDKDFL